MSVQWKQLLESLEQNPARGDLVSGVVCLCRTMQNPVEQANILTRCAALIIQVQPLVALQLVRLALLLSPRDARTLRFAKEIFKRRGRWAAEQSVGELLATLSQATAVSPPPAIPAVNTPVAPEADRFDALHSVDPIENPSMLDTNINDFFRPPTFDSSPFDDGAGKVSDEKWILDVQEHEPTSPKTDEKFVFETHAESALETENVSPAGEIDSSRQSGNIFELFLEQSGLDPDLKKFSSGFSENNLGLVAFVNLLFTMALIDEMKRTNTTIILYRMIKESEDRSGAEELFEKLFMQRSPSRDK